MLLRSKHVQFTRGDKWQMEADTELMEYVRDKVVDLKFQIGQLKEKHIKTEDTIFLIRNALQKRIGSPQLFPGPWKEILAEINEIETAYRLKYNKFASGPPGNQ